MSRPFEFRDRQVLRRRAVNGSRSSESAHSGGSTYMCRVAIAWSNSIGPLIVVSNRSANARRHAAESGRQGYFSTSLPRRRIRPFYQSEQREHPFVLFDPLNLREPLVPKELPMFFARIYAPNRQINVAILQLRLSDILRRSRVFFRSWYLLSKSRTFRANIFDTSRSLYSVIRIASRRKFFHISNSKYLPKFVPLRLYSFLGWPPARS